MPSEQAQLLRLEFKAYYRVSAEIGDKLFLFLLQAAKPEFAPQYKRLLKVVVNYLKFNR